VRSVAGQPDRPAGQRLDRDPVNPYVGAPVVVNVGGAQAGGSAVAAGVVTGVPAVDRVNVRVQYDGPDEHFHHPEWLEDVPFFDTSDYVSVNQGGLFGAFWPGGHMQGQLQTIIDQQEKIMTALQNLQAADAALTGRTRSAARRTSLTSSLSPTT
jgi:hypothetical protein